MGCGRHQRRQICCSRSRDAPCLVAASHLTRQRPLLGSALLPCPSESIVGMTISKVPATPTPATTMIMMMTMMLLMRASSVPTQASQDVFDTPAGGDGNGGHGNGATRRIFPADQLLRSRNSKHADGRVGLPRRLVPCHEEESPRHERSSMPGNAPPASCSRSKN